MGDTLWGSNDIVRALIQASPLAIVILDTNDQIRTWNPAAQRLFGWSEAEVLGQRPPFVPDDKQAEFLAIREGERAGEVLNGVELRRQRKDGTPIDVRLWTAALRDAAGRISDVLGMFEDVTDRRRAEAARRESEAQRDAVLQNVPVVLYRARASGEFAGMWVSENVERLTGFPAERFAAEPSFWASRVHPEDREEVFKTFGELQQDALATYQYRWQCADGSYRWFLDQAYLRQSNGEIPQEFLGTWLDITERKHAEILVRAQRDLALALASAGNLEEGLRRCLDTACEVAHLDSGGFYLVNEESGALELCVHRGLSPAFVRSVSSFGPESKNAGLVMAGKPVFGPYRNIGLHLTEVDRQEALHFLAAIPVLHERRVIGCMNVASHVFDNASDMVCDALEAIGAQIGQSIARLKTEDALRKSNERFRRLAADTDTGFVVLDEAGVVLEANEPYMRLADSERMEDIIGHSVIEWTAPEEREHNAAAVILCATQGKIQDFETIYLHKDGKRIHLLINATNQEVSGRKRLVSFCRDITERKAVETALTTRVRQLEAVRGVSTEMTRELDLPVLLDLVIRRAVDLFDAKSGTVRLWDDQTQTLVPVSWHGLGSWLQGHRRRLGEGLSGRVAQRREGLIVNEYRTSPYATPRVLAETGITAILAEPLLYRDRLLGVITVDHCEAGRVFSTDDQYLLGLFAAQAAIAIENARLYQEAEKQRREIEVVADLSQRLNASLDLDTVLQRVAEGARDLTGSDLAQIALREGETDTIVFRYGAGSLYGQYKDHRIEPGKGVGGKVLLTKQPFRTDNYAEDSRITKDYLAITLSEGVVAELAVPIQAEGQIEGVLFVDNRSSRSFTDRDERTLQRLADHAAIAIRNARLHAMAIQRAQQLDTLNRVALALTTELDPRDVARRILEGVQALFPGAVGRLLEHVEGAETLRVVASVGLRRPDYGHSSHLRPGEGLAGIAAATHRPVICEDITRESRFVNRAWAAAEGFMSGVVFPLLHGNRVIGILSGFLRRRHVFPDDEMQLLQALAAHAAIALENARLFKEAQIGRERLLELTKRVISAQEEERRRLSRELHDETGQALTALRINLGLMDGDVPGDAAALRQRLGDAVTLTDSVGDQVRRMAQGLRPPVLDALGVNSALEGFCRDFGRRTQLAIEYSGEDIPLPSETVGIHLYRVLQEALTNIIKHARAHRVQVALEAVDGMIRLVVEDDGVGFDLNTWESQPSGMGIGLLGMRERVEQLQGRLEIISRPGRGTRLVARIPTLEGP
jgi:PAS domain S-box-containing protein